METIEIVILAVLDFVNKKKTFEPEEEETLFPQFRGVDAE